MNHKVNDLLRSHCQADLSRDSFREPLCRRLDFVRARQKVRRRVETAGVGGNDRVDPSRNVFEGNTGAWYHGAGRVLDGPNDRTAGTLRTKDDESLKAAGQTDSQ